MAGQEFDDYAKLKYKTSLLFTKMEICSVMRNDNNFYEVDIEKLKKIVRDKLLYNDNFTCVFGFNGKLYVKNYYFVFMTNTG